MTDQDSETNPELEGGPPAPPSHEHAHVEPHGDDDTEDERPEISVVAVVEAILFATDGPIPPSKLAAIVGTGTARDMRKVVAELNARYQDQGAAFRIEEIAGGYRMYTLPEFSPWVSQLQKTRAESKLSAAAMETLAIVAYKQPAVRADVEAIRGVGCGEVLRSLMEKGLIKVVGYAEELGRPRQYGTTKKFLEVFGLRDPSDLPKVGELQPPE